MQGSFNKILIIQTAFLGDVILATSLIEKLYTYNPNAHIDFLLRKGNEGVLENNPKVQEIIIWDKSQNKYGNLFKLLKKIRANKYDLVVCVQRFAAAGLLTAFSGAKCKVGFSKNPFSCFFSKRFKHILGGGMHEIERNQQLIAWITDNNALRPKIYIKEPTTELLTNGIKKPYICIAPTSVWFTKMFPVNKWVEFIQQIPPAYSIIFIGGKQDKQAIEQIIQSIERSEMQNLAGKLSIVETAALMKEANINFVNDSAPLHIASAVNAAVCAIFCSTTPSFGFGPLSDKNYIVETHENLSCKPCGNHGKKSCPQQHFKCGQTISVSKMLETLKS